MKPSKRSHPVLLSALCAATLAAAPCCAKEAASTLKSGTAVYVLTLADLKQVSDDLRHLQAAADKLYAESTLQRVTLQTMPSFVGRGTIINVPIGAVPTGGVIPPDPHKVGMAMAEIRVLTKLLKADVQALTRSDKQLLVPGETQAQVEEQLRQWDISVSNLYGQVEVVEPFVLQPPYDVARIAQASWAMREDAASLEHIEHAMHRSIVRYQHTARDSSPNHSRSIKIRGW